MRRSVLCRSVGGRRGAGGGRGEDRGVGGEGALGGERRVSKWPRELLERAATCSPS